MHCADTPLVALLSDLEDGSPTLFVSKFSFYRISEYAPPGAGTAPKTLDITFNLSGYVTPSAAER
jgi:hypothetical protein